MVQSEGEGCEYTSHVKRKQEKEKIGERDRGGRVLKTEIATERNVPSTAGREKGKWISFLASR